jgi:hypothetical protein
VHLALPDLLALDEQVVPGPIRKDSRIVRVEREREQARVHSK